MEKRPTGQVVENAREARQGYLDSPMLVVLITSIVLIAVLFGVLWFAYFH